MIEQRNISRKWGRRLASATFGALLLVCTTLIPPAAAEKTQEPLGASISVRGSGAKAGTLISLSTSPTQKIQVAADKNGEFLFANLLYKPSKPLIFTLNIPEMKKGESHIPENNLTFNLNPSGSRAKIEGKLSKGGSIALNVEGARKPFFRSQGKRATLAFPPTARPK